MSHRIPGTSAALLMLGVLAACDLGEPADDDAGPGDTSGADYTYPASCQDIVDACHEVDPGSGPIHECHETAHDVATAEACDPVRDDCVVLCNAAADAGGEPDAEGGSEADADADADDDGTDGDPLDADVATHVHDHGADG